MDQVQSQQADSQQAKATPDQPQQKPVDVEALAKTIEARLSEKYVSQINSLTTEMDKLKAERAELANKVQTPEEFQKRLQDMVSAHSEQLTKVQQERRDIETRLQNELLIRDIRSVFTRNSVDEKQVPLLEAYFKSQVVRDKGGDLILVDADGSARMDAATGSAINFEKYFAEQFLRENAVYKRVPQVSGSGSEAGTNIPTIDLQKSLAELNKQYSEGKVTPADFKTRSDVLIKQLRERKQT